MKTKTLFILIFTGINLIGQIEKFENTPIKKDKRTIDTTRFRQFAMESNLSEIFMAGINIGFAIRPTDFFEVECNGSYLFGYNHERDRTLRANYNFYFLQKSELRPFVTIGCGAGREQYSYLTHSSATSGSGHTYHTTYTNYKYAFRKFISIGFGVLYSENDILYYKTRFSYSYNVSNEIYLLPRMEFAIGYRF